MIWWNLDYNYTNVCIDKNAYMLSFFIPLHTAITSIEGEWQSYITFTYDNDEVHIFRTLICVETENQEFTCTIGNPRYSPSDIPTWFFDILFPNINQLKDGKEQIMHLAYNGTLMNGTVIYDDQQGTYIFDGKKQLDTPSLTFEVSLFFEGYEGPLTVTHYMLYGNGMYRFNSKSGVYIYIFIYIKIVVIFTSF